MADTRTVVVTGASGGLGTAVTAAFAAQGDRVIGISHPDFDLTQPAEAARALASVGGPVHALIHLMGGFAGGQPVAETSDVTWRKMMAMNLDAAFYTARAAVPALVRQPGGRIVMVGSRTAVAPAAGLAAYNVSKAGVVALVKTLALELAPQGATANVVLPSVIDTPGNRASMPAADPGKWVKPESIAELIRWLASPQAGDVNGAAIPIYGQA